MFAIIKILSVAGFAATLATATWADEALDFAYQHFNDSADRASDIRRVPDPETGEWVNGSTMGTSPVATALRHGNATADTPNDRRGAEGVTVFIGGHSARATEIFRALAEESRENE